MRIKISHGWKEIYGDMGLWRVHDTHTHAQAASMARNYTQFIFNFLNTNATQEQTHALQLISIFFCQFLFGFDTIFIDTHWAEQRIKKKLIESNLIHFVYQRTLCTFLVHSRNNRDASFKSSINNFDTTPQFG